ncbi:MAG: GNAT family N-acetyltransferase [Bacteroidia bacterium]
MEPIIPPVDRKLLCEELKADRFLRYTNKGEKEVYLVNHHNSPNCMQEIGRLRELTFRAAGGGTGLSVDIDANDTSADCYDQLIVWDREALEIVAGYRLIECSHAHTDDRGHINLSTAHLFNYSEKFIRDYLPFTIELGRSFVQPAYQPAAGSSKGLFSLDNLWDGLGALVVTRPHIKYLFGKVTMYPHYQHEARDFILYFMNHYFPDAQNLVTPHPEIRLGYHGETNTYANMLKGLPYKEGHKVLNSFVRARGENIPPLINTYMNLSSSMKTFGTAHNDEFGAVEETGILVTITDIYPEKKSRHIDTYERDAKLIVPH